MLVELLEKHVAARQPDYDKAEYAGAMAECEKPSECPHCGADAPRAYLTAPYFAGMSSELRVAHVDETAVIGAEFARDAQIRLALGIVLGDEPLEPGATSREATPA